MTPTSTRFGTCPRTSCCIATRTERRFDCSAAEHVPRVIANRRELHWYAAERVSHRDLVAARVVEHQPGKRLLERVSCGGELCLDVVLVNVLHLERRAAELLEYAHCLERGDRVRPSQLDGRAPGVSTSHGAHGELRYVAKRDETDRLVPGTVNGRFSVREVEAEMRTQPHLHE